MPPVTGHDRVRRNADHCCHDGDRQRTERPQHRGDRAEVSGHPQGALRVFDRGGLAPQQPPHRPALDSDGRGRPDQDGEDEQQHCDAEDDVELVRGDTVRVDAADDQGEDDDTDDVGAHREGGQPDESAQDERQVAGDAIDLERITRR